MSKRGLLQPDQPLSDQETRKRKREKVIIAVLGLGVLATSIAVWKMSRFAASLPFANSIFFFGLININLILLVGLLWLIFRNIGRIVIERRRRVLGSRLKTKLVVAFLAFSITPTLILFAISSLYINSSFDKWFSLKVQNTLQASVEIGRTYYKNTDQRGFHFARHVAEQLSKRIQARGRFMDPEEVPDLLVDPNRKWIQEYLDSDRNLLALDSIEFYVDPLLEERLVSVSPDQKNSPELFPRMSVETLDKAFGGSETAVVHHVGNGDLIRTMVPVWIQPRLPRQKFQIGVVSVNTYVPIGLSSKVDEVATVFDDYRETNPLIYPIKTQYFVILILITLVIIAVAIWIGLYLAKELTVPMEGLITGAHAVGAGDLDVTVTASGDDEIRVLIDAFNRMIHDLKDNRSQLQAASQTIEQRRVQLEAVLTNIGTGVLVTNSDGVITSFNRAAAQLLRIPSETALQQPYSQTLRGEAKPLADLIQRTLEKQRETSPASGAEVSQWTQHFEGQSFSYAGIATLLKGAAPTGASAAAGSWGVVVVIDDITHLVKAQREMAWREVARRIAHEIKNPLTPIKLSAQRLQRRLGNLTGQDGVLLRECTDTIVRHTDELKEMVNEFSAFARMPEVNPAPNNLNEVISEVIALYAQAHPQVQFHSALEPRLPVFDFDRDQIKRVFVNLMDNAMSAMAALQKGTAKVINLDTHYNERLQLAMILVRDNGPGMSEDVRARAFEPYFSTKKEGTGLGLAIAKRIVNDHNGFIRVQPVLDRGTEFIIELPTAPAGSRRVDPNRPKPDLKSIPILTRGPDLVQ